ncbi:MAG: CRISPR-associated protein Cas4 [Bacillota bacterium]
MRITDFKSGWTRYRPTDKAQLPLYALLVAEERGLDAVTGRLWFLPYKRSAVEEEIIDRRRMEEAREWAIDQVSQIDAALELPAATGFPATPGSACRLCSFGAHCLGLDVPPSAEDAAALALRLERALDAVRSLVKAQVDTGGPVRVGGEEFKNWPRVSWSFDTKALAEFLQGAI